jgi:hypothetical protein
MLLLLSSALVRPPLPPPSILIPQGSDPSLKSTCSSQTSSTHRRHPSRLAGDCTADSASANHMVQSHNRRVHAIRRAFNFGSPGVCLACCDGYRGGRVPFWKGVICKLLSKPRTTLWTIMGSTNRHKIPQQNNTHMSRAASRPPAHSQAACRSRSERVRMASVYLHQIQLPGPPCPSNQQPRHVTRRLGCTVVKILVRVWRCDVLGCRQG